MCSNRVFQNFPGDVYIQQLIKLRILPQTGFPVLWTLQIALKRFLFEHSVFVGCIRHGVLTILNFEPAPLWI